MRLGIPFTILHLVTAFVCALVAADAGGWDVRARWIVVILAVVGTVLNTGAVVTALV